jgi:hypothetical protein
MSRRHALAAIIATLPIWPAAARADIPPPPDVVQRQFADTIRQAGHDCTAVTSFNHGTTSPDGDALVWGGQRPALAICSNGKRFLVAVPPPRPNFRPPPLPPPPAVRVKPL